MSRVRSGSLMPLLAALILLIGLLPKLIGAVNMGFDVDIVPVVMRGTDWLVGGGFPVYGTLSSVSAYNMPMLPWLHLPALLITQEPRLVMLWTSLFVHLIGAAAVYRLGADAFNPRVGLLALIFFTFSDTGIYGSFTAWAQLWLPTFFALVLWTLFRWWRTGGAGWLAASGVLATVAFMLHFGAVLLFPAMLVFALLTRSRWRPAGLLIGGLLVVLLLAPYLSFQLERDFADLRAFFNREPLVGAEAIAQAAYLKPEGPPLIPPYDAPPPTPGTPSGMAAPTPQTDVTTAPPTVQRSIVERLLSYALTVPEQYRVAFWLAYRSDPAGWQSTPVYALAVLFNHLLSVAFWIGAAWALWAWRQGAAWGRHYGLMLVFLAVIQAGFVLTRTPPWEQPSYYPGFVSVQLLLSAVAVDRLVRWLPGVRLQRALLVGVAVLAILFGGGDRILRVLQHDDAADKPLNLWLYRQIDAVTTLIAVAWPEDEVVVRYDLLPEARNLWWIVPWNAIDADYTYGLPYDYLLRHKHGVRNLNQNPTGWADDPDFIVTTLPGVARYPDAAAHEIARYGRLVLLRGAAAAGAP